MKGYLEYVNYSLDDDVVPWLSKTVSRLYQMYQMQAMFATALNSHGTVLMLMHCCCYRPCSRVGICFDGRSCLGAQGA
jgi:hypothetical protein